MKNILLLFSLVLTFSISLAAVRTVNIVGLNFVPETLSAYIGDTIRWINADSRIHTTTSGANGVSNGIWNSGNMAQNDSFRFVFNSLGNYPYFCIPHYAMGMTGLIMVNASDIKEVNLPAKPMLSVQVFPNPFHGYTIIDYQIAVLSKVEMRIFDAVGKPIKTLVRGILPAGWYRVSWDGTYDNNQPVQNGLYFYRINFNGVNYTGKILETD